MSDLKCPKCGITIEAPYSRKACICPKCLEHNGETVIMVESNTHLKPRYLGDGMFEIPKGN